MALNRQLTDEEKAHRGRKSIEWWASPAGRAARARRSVSLAQWNKTRVFSDEARRASGERLTKINKTREHSQEERRATAERVRERMASGWKRPPMTETEKKSVRKRMYGNTFGTNNTMSDERREFHRQLMLTKNPGIGAHKTPNLRHPGPNKAEARLDKLIAHLGFRFVGDAKFWIGPGPSGMMRNPDWIYGDGKTLKIAALHHGEYWHRLRGPDDDVAMADYESLGWKVLVIWERENRRIKFNPALTEKVRCWLDGVLLETSQ